MLASYSSAAFSVASGLAVAANADIRVYLDGPGGGALAPIFSDVDGLTAIDQTGGAGFEADANGRFNFYAAGRVGGYRITVTKGAESYELRHVAIGTAAQLDASSVGQGVLTAADQAAGRSALDAAADDEVNINLHALFGVL